MPSFLRPVISAFSWAQADKRVSLVIIITHVKVHTSCFQNKNYKWNKTYPTFLMASFKFSWTFLQLSVSIFNKFCSTSWDLLLRIYWNLFFHNTAWNLLHVIYLYVLKSVKNFKAKNKLKELILADISCIQQLSHAI